MKLDRLDVTIQQKRSRFIATSVSFPTCKGIGATESLALKQLSGSIGRFITKSATEAIEDLLTSDDYTEVVSPVPIAEDSAQSKRIYTVDTPLSWGGSGSSDKSKLRQMPYALEDLVEDNVRDLIQSEIDMVLEDGPSSLLGQSRYRQDDDGAFGILMSLN